ncbi:MAG: hypothetical protein MJA29_05235 [Candidatus Omnitrophica bacterium]|nr:hypothetical protein [Candidatus Omnitrophota bacterium]
MKDSRQTLISFSSSAGCLLPVLICTNLFFGWLILPVVVWLGLELLLLALFLLNSYLMISRIRTLSGRRKVIDVEAKRKE